MKQLKGSHADVAACVRRHLQNRESAVLDAARRASLGPCDIALFEKAPVGTFGSEEGRAELHTARVLGLPCSAAEVAAFFHGVISETDRVGAATGLFANRRWRVRWAVYCCYDVFSRQDVRYELHVPGGMEAYATDAQQPRGRQAVQADAVLLSSFLRSELLGSCGEAGLEDGSDTQLLRLPPVPSVAAEARLQQALLSGAEAQQLQGRALDAGGAGRSPACQAVDLDPLLACTLKHFQRKQRWMEGAAFFQRLSRDHPSAAAAAAECCRRVGAAQRAAGVMVQALRARPNSTLLLVAQGELLLAAADREETDIEEAFAMARAALENDGDCLPAWLLLVDVFAAAEAWSLAFICLNACLPYASLASVRDDLGLQGLLRSEEAAGSWSWRWAPARQAGSGANVDLDAALERQMRRDLRSANAELLRELPGHALQPWMDLRRWSRCRLRRQGGPHDALYSRVYRVLLKAALSIGWGQMLHLQTQLFHLDPLDDDTAALEAQLQSSCRLSGSSGSSSRPRCSRPAEASSRASPEPKGAVVQPPAATAPGCSEASAVAAAAPAGAAALPRDSARGAHDAAQGLLRPTLASLAAPVDICISSEPPQHHPASAMAEAALLPTGKTDWRPRSITLQLPCSCHPAPAGQRLCSTDAGRRCALPQPQASGKLRGSCARRGPGARPVGEGHVRGASEALPASSEPYPEAAALSLRSRAEDRQLCWAGDGAGVVGTRRLMGAALQELLDVLWADLHQFGLWQVEEAAMKLRTGTTVVGRTLGADFVDLENDACEDLLDAMGLALPDTPEMAQEVLDEGCLGQLNAGDWLARGLVAQRLDRQDAAENALRCSLALQPSCGATLQLAGLCARWGMAPECLSECARCWQLLQRQLPRSCPPSTACATLSAIVSRLLQEVGVPAVLDAATAVAPSCPAIDALVRDALTWHEPASRPASAS